MMNSLKSQGSWLRAIAIFGLTGLASCSGTGGGADAPLAPVIVSEVDRKEMVLIPAGEFVMGTNKTDPENMHQKIGTVKPLYLDQHPEHKVNLEAYYIDRYEVTNREYQAFLDDTGYPDVPGNWENGMFLPGRENHPVTHVTWQEALTYALWAHKRLPSEAQWEKAARGPNGNLYPWGNEYQKGKGNIAIEGARDTAPVGSYPGDVSFYQVYDMAGNAMEWTRDWYRPYPGNTYNDSRFGEKFRVLRGTSYQKAGHYFLDAYQFAFARTEVDPEGYYENVGFRCVFIPSQRHS
ncbi:MAG: hypothetical protein COV67_07460 [Nitrospinae bacterium CG11_big_fil_rev_8_21_14_0_20_56_8]|nr:MAG: hypothetical protein COV67_07460 [Nitrospinae bacterium CG11_big_fil_rev_8_21_14_0_20_56_8]